MVAININTGRIVFKNGLSDIERYRIIKDLWFNNPLMMSFEFPEPLISIPLVYPEAMKLNIDRNYL